MTGQRSNPLAERLFQSGLAVLDIFTIYLGDRLGLYRALFEGGPATSGELAERTGTFERYVREWLEQQAVTGIIEVDEPSSDARARRYRLSPENAEVLVDQGSINFEAHKGIDFVRGARPLPALVEAFRTGDGLPPLAWEPEGRAEFNRARFLQLLGRVWLPAIPPVHQRLMIEPPARIADLGCGTGWSSIAMAQAYPLVRVDGFDLDEAAIAHAGENATAAGVDARVRFRAIDVATLEDVGGYDLVTVFEALHDMARPVDALRVLRGLLSEAGSAVIADERVGEAFAIPAPEQERYAYGWSVVTCLPSAMGEPGAAGTGAVMRPSTLRRYAEEAGFSEVEVLPVQDIEWRFYRLIP
jgi:2-polyprenyl-3-methyl-5-hydroxy-6-metoxy-1,4-benzoquinol methylase